jgi:hypothetical protein
MYNQCFARPTSTHGEKYSATSEKREVKSLLSTVHSLLDFLQCHHPYTDHADGVTGVYNPVGLIVNSGLMMGLVTVDHDDIVCVLCVFVVSS